MYECKLSSLEGSVSMDQLLKNGVAASTAMFHRLQTCGERRQSEGGSIQEVCPECPARRIKRVMSANKPVAVGAAA